MQVILLEKVLKLGNLGDVVNVKDGYARNYLIPQKKALFATKANKELFEAQKADFEAQNAAALEAAKTLSEKIDGQKVIAIRQAGDTGHLYGSVSTRDVADMLKEKGLEVSYNNVIIDQAIKEIGIYTVRVALHADAVAKVTVNVARSEEEAKQAEEAASKPKAEKTEKVTEAAPVEEVTEAVEEIENPIAE